MSFMEPDDFDFPNAHLHMSIDLTYEEVSSSNRPLSDSPKQRLIKPNLHSVSCPSIQINETFNNIFHEAYDNLYKNENLSKTSINIEGLITNRIIRNTGSNGNDEGSYNKIQIPMISQGSNSSITGEFLSKVLKTEIEPQTTTRTPLDDCTQRINTNNLYFTGKTKRKMEIDFKEYENDVFAVQSLPDFPLLKQENILFRRTFSEISLSEEIGTATCKKTSIDHNTSEIYIGDLTRPHSLPIMTHVKEELVYITPQTIADVLEGRASLKMDEVVIVDCRYPYEYNGGHIKSSLNIYTKQGLLNYFMGGNSTSKNCQTKAIVFHCEFSQIRGPALARFLRNRDRSVHFNKYPKLFYPEIYVLHGGYRDFYQSFPNLCCPTNYITMNDSRFSLEYAKFRRQSKSSMYRESKSATISHV